jgi:Arc-like DNA binding domain
MPHMSRLDPSLKIRLPEEMRDMIGVAARKNRRSMNAEVVARLAESFDMEAETEQGDVPTSPTAREALERVKTLEARVSALEAKL